MISLGACMFESKVILITGGTGSFGSTFAQKLLTETEVAEVRIFSRDEKKQEDLRNRWKDGRLRFYLGDVRDADGLRQAMRGVDYLFHAAALKQVPSCELHPLQAIQTNVLGAQRVIQSALESGVKRAIFLSTDKAVYPINTVGHTKALMEKMVIACSKEYRPGSTLFCCTRYGNVMSSRGSVIPLFIEQMERGEPLTITHPEMTRFMMSLKESVDLVLYALQRADPGDIFVQKSPAVAIPILVQSLQELFEQKREVQIIGIRPGEKVHETLISREEIVRVKETEHYFCIPCEKTKQEHSTPSEIIEPFLHPSEGYTSQNTRRLNVEEMKELLLTIDSLQEQLPPLNLTQRYACAKGE